jgi:hypothetical protein
MLAHALTIVVNELNRHLVAEYGAVAPQAALGNLSEGLAGAGGGGIARDMLYLSIVNTKEEKTLKNIQTFVRNDSALTVRYENPPVFLNFGMRSSAGGSGKPARSAHCDCRCGAGDTVTAGLRSPVDGKRQTGSQASLPDVQLLHGADAVEAQRTGPVRDRLSAFRQGDLWADLGGSQDQDRRQGAGVREQPGHLECRASFCLGSQGGHEG